jgi:hypothetical protein
MRKSLAPGEKRQRIDLLIFYGCLVALLLLLAYTKPLGDFVEYWTSAHQLVNGGNPYSPRQILRLEVDLGWKNTNLPLMNLAPPWALLIAGPLGLFHSYRLAFVVWTGLLAFVAWVATRMLFSIYSPGKRIFPSDQGALVFTFIPAVAGLWYAQMTPLILFGLAGFLWFEEKKREMVAGMCLALATVKPQLLYLLWFALLLDSWQRRKWKVLMSFAAAIGLLSGAVALIHRQIFAEYLDLASSGYVRIWPSALGGILRIPFGYVNGNFAWQFVAPAVGTIWFLWYWSAHREGWNWKERIPELLTVSVLTSIYGWYSDQILLMVPVVAIAAKYANEHGSIPRQATALYTAVNVSVAALVLFQPYGISLLAFLVAPVVTLFSLHNWDFKQRIWGVGS